MDSSSSDLSSTTRSTWGRRYPESKPVRIQGFAAWAADAADSFHLLSACKLPVEANLLDDILTHIEDVAAEIVHPRREYVFDILSQVHILKH